MIGILLCSLYAAFLDPPQSAKPWTYYLWKNTHVDYAIVAADVADMSKMGFGGFLLSDSRGYWDDDDHVVTPKALVKWGSDEWLDLVAHAVRCAESNGMQMAINVAASGGHLKGAVDTGSDGPKFLKCRRYAPGDAFERPDIPNYRDVAVFAVRTELPAGRSAWRNAGDGFMSMENNVGKSMDASDAGGRIRALEVRELCSVAEGAGLGDEWVVVRIGYGTVPGREADVDVLDSHAVRRHLDRVVGRLLDRIPGLFGAERALSCLYNVSWEGTMPTWSVTFEEDFGRIDGAPLRANLPILAGFDLDGVDADSFMRRFRRARGVIMRDHLYRAVMGWAHEKGMLAFSESGGPWGFGERNPKTFGECDQLSFLAANDFPQGEFWPLSERGESAGAGHANANGRFFVRGVVSAAHAYGMKMCSAEAFTHMLRHWSVDPAFLKPVGDQAFADGINRFVWHTYTASPPSFGVPGLEYFAGSHVNRNVTWHDGAFPFVRYIARCQYLLQKGSPVVDIAVLCGDRPYAGEGVAENGRLRNSAAWGTGVTIPAGFSSDILNDEVLASRSEILKNYRIVYDARIAENQGRAVPTGSLPPDVETAANYTWCHRRIGESDIYFIAGEGSADIVFRAAAPRVESWDAVIGRRDILPAERLADGRTRVRLDLPVGGSCFVVFAPEDGNEEWGTGNGWAVSMKPPRPTNCQNLLTNAWRVSFAYHDGITAQPPAPVTMETLRDFTSYGTDGDAASTSIRYFSGTATYRTTFSYFHNSIFPQFHNSTISLSLGNMPSGLAHVFVNGVDCGFAWCAPWEVDVSSAIREGENKIEIRYTNNWCNRLVGDCFLPPEKRVTRSVLHYWNTPRTQSEPGNRWTVRPTVYSGYSVSDPLQPSGLLGPVELVCGVRCRLAMSLAAKWDFENNDGLVMKECAILAEPGRGKCLKLVSLSSRATVETTAALPDVVSPKGPYTLAIWLRPDKSVISDADVEMAKLGGRRMTKFASAMHDGKWHHLAVTYDPARTNAEYAAYLDWPDERSPWRFMSFYEKDTGMSKCMLPFSFGDGKAVFGGKVGMSLFSIGYSGMIDDVAVYNRALTDDEVRGMAVAVSE